METQARDSFNCLPYELFLLRSQDPYLIIVSCQWSFWLPGLIFQHRDVENGHTKGQIGIEIQGRS